MARARSKGGESAGNRTDRPLMPPPIGSSPCEHEISVVAGVVLALGTETLRCPAPMRLICPEGVAMLSQV
jgi:hypothetical protein